MSITTETAKNLILDAGVIYKNYGIVGQSILGSTTGGSSFVVEREIREIEVDGTRGKVKGLRRIIAENAMLTVNLKEMSTANLMLALPGSTSTTPTVNTTVSAEYLGLGTGVTETFTFDHAPILGTEKFYINGAEVDWVRGTNYTISGTTLTIIGNDTLALDAQLTSGYVWNSGGIATHDVITSSGVITDSDYLDNLALVATVSGSDKPIVIVLSDVLADGGFEMALEDKNEAVVEIQFSAHYNPENLTKVPYEIRYPKISV